MENVLVGFPKERWSLLWAEERATRISSLEKTLSDEEAVVIRGQRVLKDLNKVFRKKVGSNRRV